MQVIQSVIVLTSQDTRTYEVGGEVRGQAIIEIKNMSVEYEDHIHSEYHVFGEDEELIATVENCPVIVEWQKIAVDGDPGC